MCCMILTRHMFEVEQIDYDKEQIDWSYITFNDNKVRHSTHERHNQIVLRVTTLIIVYNWR